MVLTIGYLAEVRGKDLQPELTEVCLALGRHDATRELKQTSKQALRHTCMRFATARIYPCRALATPCGSVAMNALRASHWWAPDSAMHKNSMFTNMCMGSAVV